MFLENNYYLKTEETGKETSNLADIQADLLAFISKSFMVEPEEVPLDRSMIDEGIIDSFGLVEISAFLEKHYSIKIREDDMIRANFGSVLKIVAFVKRQMAQ